MASASPKMGLATEIELALNGAGTSPGELAGPEPCVVWIMKQGELPRALVTDARGVTTPKIVDFVDILRALDDSCVIEELQKEPPERAVPLPALPEGALLLNLTERLSATSYVVTGAARAREHPFSAHGGPVGSEDLVTTHDINLPPIVYRASWTPSEAADATAAANANTGAGAGHARHDPPGRLRSLHLALCSPDLKGNPTADTELYRWPWQHVYDHDTGGFGAYYGKVCWDGLAGVRCRMGQIAELAVGAFVSDPNDAGPDHAGQLSPYAPTRDYRGFLRACEERGGLEHDWLEPLGMTVEDFHHQTRRES